MGFFSSVGFWGSCTPQSFTWRPNLSAPASAEAIYLALTLSSKFLPQMYFKALWFWLYFSPQCHPTQTRICCFMLLFYWILKVSTVFFSPSHCPKISKMEQRLFQTLMVFQGILYTHHILLRQQQNPSWQFSVGSIKIEGTFITVKKNLSDTCSRFHLLLSKCVLYRLSVNLFFFSCNFRKSDWKTPVWR